VQWAAGTADHRRAQRSRRRRRLRRSESTEQIKKEPSASTSATIAEEPHTHSTAPPRPAAAAQGDFAYTSSILGDPIALQSSAEHDTGIASLSSLSLSSCMQ
jgi:hypothetical protein